MIKTETTPTIRRIMKYAIKCPLCRQPITEFDDFQFTKFRVGRRFHYSFFHTNCLVNQDDLREG